MTLRPLRPHQEGAMLALRRSLSSGRLSPILAAPTGFGKTRVMAEIALGASAKGKRVLITVPALSLVDQTVRALRDEGLDDIGVMQGLHELTNSAASIQVASVQTLARRKLPAADVILVDEAHRWFRFFAPMMADAREGRVPVIGLSATPWTKGLGKHYDDLIQAATTADLIKAGFLSPFRVFAPSHPDLSDVHTVAGDYHEGELAEAMNKPELVADVVSTWLRLGRGRPTLCFGVDRAHARHLQERFDAVEVATAYIDAHTPREERAKIFGQFSAGRIEIICNVGCLTTGVDLDVRCIILARPTQSEILFTQIVGRGLRAAAGKTDCLILDHSNTHSTLGLVTDIAYDKLDDGSSPASAKSRERKEYPRECPSCSFVRPAHMRACPECGFAPERQTNVQVAEGELVAFEHKEPPELASRKASVFGQLLWIAREKGYAKGWASHKFREYFGVWPNAVGRTVPIEPEPETRTWVKSRQIAYAKGRAKARSAA